MSKTQIRPVSTTKRYGITEKKKSELDARTVAVQDAQYDVAQAQAVVTALTEKQQSFLSFLVTADASRAQALVNRNLVDQLVQSALDLERNSKIAFTEMSQADKSTKDLAKSIKAVIDKLIYSAEIINKLSNLVIRKKALNPLISDELVSMLGTAGNDANNAVALTLVALKSTFAAQAANMESESALVLEYDQSMMLYRALTGLNAETVSPKTSMNAVQKQADTSLKGLLYSVYANSKANYKMAQKANVITTNQLNDATTALNKAQVKLKSLQLGLAAGTAAALAS
ncbi:MAG: hypothetical protein JWO44_1334 [Bacteroidetes bacterium]|nr:hypothetical protein [Bacteroidota bacterium]